MMETQIIDYKNHPEKIMKEFREDFNDYALNSINDPDEQKQIEILYGTVKTKIEKAATKKEYISIDVHDLHQIYCGYVHVFGWRKRTK